MQKFATVTFSKRLVSPSGILTSYSSNRRASNNLISAGASVASVPEAHVLLGHGYELVLLPILVPDHVVGFVAP